MVGAGVMIVTRIMVFSVQDAFIVIMMFTFYQNFAGQQVLVSYH